MIRESGQGMKVALNEGFNPAAIAKGILISYIVTVPIFMVFAYMLTFTSFPSRFISPAVVITTIISILVAGSTVTKTLRNKGWLNGAFVGLIYMSILYVVSSLVFDDFSVNKPVVTAAVLGVLTGSIGGIMGINMKRGSHSKRKN